MEMEEKHSNPSDKKMLPVLKEVMESSNATEELQTRMAPQTSNRTIVSIEDTIREFLAISGIDALLPLDCGKVSSILSLSCLISLGHTFN